jgi:hypothetical protein
VSSGRVYGGAQGVPESATRYDEYGRAFKNEAPPPPPQPQAQPRPVNRPAEHAQVYSGGRPRRSAGARFVLVLLVLVLLVTVPLAAGVVSYYLTTDHWPALLQDWFGSNPP